MRGSSHCLALSLCLLASALLPTAAGAQDSRWRPAASHSTIDRSSFETSLDGAAPVFTTEVSPPILPAGNAILQTAQSPEVETIESPLTPQPLADSYFPAEINPNQDCPDCYTEPQSWIVRNSTDVTATWLPAGADEIGWTDFDLKSKFAFPTLENLTVKPGFQMHFIDGPTRTDLPEQLYNAQVELRWKQQISRPFWVEGGITPGVFSDFETSSGDAFRLRAQGLAFFAFSYETQIVAGLYYLDRFDINFLPIFGLIHSPREDIQLNLVFPAPRISKRVYQGGWKDDWWLYLAGEFGGGAWAVERVPGALPGGKLEDQIAYRDWRLILGLERKVGEGTTMFVEGGYVFNRQLEYDSGVGDFDPDDTMMMRAGLSY